jgi:putative PIN family toxin of toxin-antitoxin system
MPSTPSVVYDCMVFLQAVANPNGPAFRCFEAIESKHATLLLSPSIVLELHNVLNRPYLRTKLKKLTAERVAEFLERLLLLAEHRSDAIRHFALPRDPDDEIYLNLALEAQASYLVTWNHRHLTYLMSSDAPEAQDFRQSYPSLTILDPPSFLGAINFKSTEKR